MLVKLTKLTHGRNTALTAIAGVVAVVFSSVFCGVVTAQEQGWAAKMLEKPNLDFGVVARGSDAVYRLKLKNIYSQPVTISGTRTSCQCAKVKASADVLNPGEEGYLEISMDTVSYMREKTSNAIATFSTPNYASSEVWIPLKVYIRTDVVITPGAANFGVVDVGRSATRKLTIAYAGRPDWKILDVKTSNPHVSATVVETSRVGGNANYDLVVNLDEKAPAGALRTEVILVTDDQGSPEVPVLVDASIESDIVVTPGLQQWGTVAAGQRKDQVVVVRGRKPFVITRVESTRDVGNFKVKMPKDARPVHTLPMTFEPAEGPAEIDEVFSIFIEGRDAPVTFRAVAKVSAGDATIRPQGGSR